ncbi:MAG: ribulose-5-phosphate 4-epimerase/fuculose-1-phosphate aldolase [Desulforhopalus sp.]|jgi:ribulose-5-phosphate 4-epimerase/fuculose-1-phosphate aldolase
METYQGVKFNHLKVKNDFNFDHRLTELNQLAYLFSQLGLTPVHPEGAYGNQSYRTTPSSFIVTKSGMIPDNELAIDNYCEISGYTTDSTTFLTHGPSVPSSESFLHYDIYMNRPRINVILHGHSKLLNDYAKKLSIPTTETFYDYGTQELAQSALELARKEIPFFILKDHGFVALGHSIKETGSLVLDYYGRLINLIKKK